jgi:hypothetical protein
MKRLSHKRTATFSEQCSSCRFFFEWLHPGRSGDVCLVCSTLEGETRSRLPAAVEHGPPGRVLRVR